MRGKLVDREHAERVWDALARDSFHPASIRRVALNERVGFLVVGPPPGQEFTPDVYLDTGLSFYAWPRLRAYRHRFVLIPRENLASGVRWQLHQHDVADWIYWSRLMEHVVTFSTLKSGASFPWSLHAQSFPWRMANEEGDLYLTALNSPQVDSQLDVAVEFGAMPQFETLRIELLHGDYPVNGIRISYNDLVEGPKQAALKVFELAANYNAFTSFNVVIVPRQFRVGDASDEPVVYFFPRRKDGRAIYQMDDHRWQIAAIEMNGLMQVKSERQEEMMTARRIVDIFRKVSNHADYENFCELIQTF